MLGALSREHETIDGHCKQRDGNSKKELERTAGNKKYCDRNE